MLGGLFPQPEPVLGKVAQVAQHPLGGQATLNDVHLVWLHQFRQAEAGTQRMRSHSMGSKMITSHWKGQGSINAEILDGDPIGGI